MYTMYSKCHLCHIFVASERMVVNEGDTCNCGNRVDVKMIGMTV
jgi:hypothetical protein